MIYLISGIIVIAFLIKVQEWHEKANAWDRYNYSKQLVYLPSIKELIQSEEERRWEASFRAFFHKGKEFIIWLRRKRRIVN